MRNGNGQGRRGIVVITGASAGVGRAAARAFAGDGWDVGLIARGKDGLEGARREVEQLGGKALVLPCDVADEAAVREAARRVEEELGPIDVWVNNAMVTVFSPVALMTAGEYKRVTEVNYLGYVHGTLAALEHMTMRNRGTIVQVSSALAYRSIPLQSAYCASKHAVKGFTESLITELLHDDSAIDVVMVHMPALNTPQFDWSRSKMPRKAQPVPPIFEPEVAADAILYAAKNPQRRSVTVGATAMQAILGNHIAPSILDRYLGATGYDSQMTDEPENPERHDNLFEPVPGDHGAHGRFDDCAKSRSIQLWANERRGMLGVAAAGLAVIGAAALVAKARS